MKFIINNQTYKLERLRRSDYKAYYYLSLNNDFVALKKFNTYNDAKNELFKLYFKRDVIKTTIPFKIINKTNKEMIGIVEFHTLDRNTNTVELGYVLDKNYWNKGIMSVAVAKVLDLGFKKYLFDTITANCFSDNEVSMKILTNLGFSFDKVEVTADNKKLFYFKIQRSYYNDTKTKRNL